MNLSGPERRFANSSKFRHGDNTSFRIHLDRSGKRFLPGKHDPKTYLDRLDINKVAGKTAVICPANGGLVAEMIHRGSDEVHAFEPRKTFHDGFKGAMAFVDKGDSVVMFHPRWSLARELKGEFSMILWTENFDTCGSPITHLKNVLSMLASDGVLIMEVIHGNHMSPSMNMNRWNPLKEEFKKFIERDCLGFSANEISLGRFDRRVIYKIQPEMIVVVDDGDDMTAMTAEIEDKDDKLMSIFNEPPVVESSTEKMIKDDAPKKSKPRKKAEKKSAKRTKKGLNSKKKAALAKIAKMKRDKQEQEAVSSD